MSVFKSSLGWVIFDVFWKYISIAASDKLVVTIILISTKVSVLSLSFVCNFSALTKQECIYDSNHFVKWDAINTLEFGFEFESVIIKFPSVSPFIIKTVWYPVIKHPDNKVHWANMGPTWVLSAPVGSHVDPMNLVIRAYMLDSVTNTERIITILKVKCGSPRRYASISIILEANWSEF